MIFRYSPFSYSLKTFTFKIRGDEFSGKIFIQQGPPPILGDRIIVTISKTGFSLTADQLRNWLSLFGTIEGNLEYKHHPKLPTIKDDICEVIMKLSRHIPATLPAYGRKVQVHYRGQSIQCSKCYNLGHVRRLCTAETSNWLGYVKQLLETRNIPESYFGVWLEHLRSHEAIVNEDSIFTPSQPR